MVRVELVYVSKDKTTVYLHLQVPDESTVSDVLRESNIYQIHPETIHCAVGIYGHVVALDTRLRDGDRVELYRPLVLDPKEKRRLLAKERAQTKRLSN